MKRANLSCCRVLIFLAVSVMLSVSASAATRTWNAPVGDPRWNHAPNWLPVGMPLAGEDVYVVHTGTEYRFCIYSDITAPTYDYVQVDDIASAFGMELEQNSYTLNANKMDVGYDGLARYDFNGGWANIGTLALGRNTGSDGTCIMSNPPDSASLSTNRCIVGLDGTGRFEQWLGTHTVSHYLYVGDYGAGTYVLKPDAVLDSNDTTVGIWDVGTFEHEGGTHNVVIELVVGREYQGDGTYNLSGGTLNTPVLTLGATRIASAFPGTGTFNQTGGNNFADDVYIGESNGGVGTYNFSGGNLANTNQYVGYSGTGTFVHGNNRLNNVTSLYVGHQSDGEGTYTINSGYIHADNEVIGVAGTGTFVQNAGQLSVYNNLMLGSQPGSLGTYNLNWGYLDVDGDVRVGNSGQGIVNHEAGTITIFSDLYFGYNSDGWGKYVLNETGVSKLDSTANEYIGYHGIGVFEQNDGTHDVGVDSYIGHTTNSQGVYTQNGGDHTVTNELYLGYGYHCWGTYHLHGGTVDVGQNEYVGYEGTGTFTQDGGTHTVGNLLYLGYLADGTGTYNLIDGDLQTYRDRIGYEGTGTFNQSGGTHTLTGWIALGSSSGSTGTYNLTGGTLNTSSIGNGAGTSTFVIDNGATLNLGTSLTVHYMYVAKDGTHTYMQPNKPHSIFETLYVGYNAGSNGTYNLSANTLSTKNTVIGWKGTGAFNQTGGAHTVSSRLILGEETGGVGTYTLDAGALSTQYTYVGEDGTGSFYQDGGTHDIVGSLYVGHILGTGSYELTDGDLAVGGNEVVGDYSPGSFVQSGGTNTVQGDFYVAMYDGSGGSTCDMTDGTLDALQFATIGMGDVGTFTQSGGTATVGNALVIGHGSPGVGGAGDGTYNLSGTGILNCQGDVRIADGDVPMGVLGTGAFNQSGGTHTVDWMLAVGYAEGATGTYDLSGGDLIVHRDITVGHDGNGSFTQSGGTNTIDRSLIVGYGSSSYGQYDLSGGDLIVGNDIQVGHFGQGIFNQTGGTATAAWGVLIALADDAIGEYNLGDGTLDAGWGQVGGNGTGTFTQTGGTHTTTDLRIGYASFGDGTYNLSGTGVLTVNGDEVIGNEDSTVGRFVQTGWTHTITGYLTLGHEETIYGTPEGNYDLQSGGLSVGMDEFIGNEGAGSFVQSGGTHTVSGSLILARSWEGIGSYELTSGVLSAGSEIVGQEGVGTFVQSGGTHTVTNNLYVGQNQSAGGSHFALSAGSLDVGLNTFVGYNCQASFNQSGSGAHTVHELIVGFGSGGEGESTYTLSNGAPLTVAGDETIGHGAQGRFIQNNGTHSVGERLMLGYSYGYASFELGLGTLDTGDTYVGYEGYGDFTQNGGSHTITGELVIGEHDDSGGTYTLNDGTLSANAEIIGGGSGTWGEFWQNGGTNTVATTLTVGSDSGGEEGGSGTYNLEGGALTSADIDNNGTVNQSGGTLDTGLFQNDGTFNQTGGTMTADTFNNTGGPTTYVHAPAIFQADTVNNSSEFYLYGGTVRGATSLMGTFNNNGSLYMYGGTFEDYLVNQNYFYYSAGTFNGIYEHWTGAWFDRDGDFTAEGGIINYGDLTSGPGYALNGNGLGIHNYGWFYLYGGTTSATVFTNDFGGYFSGYGTIDADLVNNGTLDTEGLLVVTGTTTNLGQITVEQGEHFRATAGLANTGIVELMGGAVSGTGTFVNGPGGIVRGYGGVTAPMANDGGVIHATGTQLTVTNLSGGNVNGGELRVDDGSRLHIVSAFASSGTIVLNGENAELLGGTITNSGTLSGSGRVSNTVLNSGVIRASGGLLTLSGAGNTNAAAGRIEVFNGATLVYSQGLATNAGTIAMTGGTFDTNATAITNAGSILGRGTVTTGGITNDNLMAFADGDTDIYGDVTNNDAINVTECLTTFFGDVTNSVGGEIKNTDGVVRFLGDFVNNGTYTSDPADNYFTDVSVGTTGTFVGGAGDRFLVSGDFSNASTASTAWDTSDAELIFEGGTGHTFELPGSDIGRYYAGLVDNFAWGILRLESGDWLTLADGNTVPGAATYVTGLILEGGLAQIASVTGNGFSIYYDPLSPDNAYLAGATYSLTGGGVVAPMSGAPPIPEPAGLALAGLALLALRRRPGWRCSR